MIVLDSECVVELRSKARVAIGRSLKTCEEDFEAFEDLPGERVGDVSLSVATLAQDVGELAFLGDPEEALC